MLIGIPKPHHSARLKAFERRIGQSQRRTPIGEPWTGLAVLLHGGDQMIKLGAVGRCIAVEEEVEVRGRGLGLSRTGQPNAGRMLIADAQHSGGAEGLEPLVIAEHAATTVRNLT